MGLAAANARMLQGVSTVLVMALLHELCGHAKRWPLRTEMDPR
jgi:hypothetical protein